MKKSTKILFSASLSINILVFLSVTFFIYTKGGLSYLTNKAQATFGENTALVENPKHDIFKMYKQDAGSVVFLGDSLTDNIEWAEMFPNLKVYNRGVAGQTSSEVSDRTLEAVEEKPSKLFIMMGANDIGRGLDVEGVVSNYKKALEVTKQKSPNTKIYIQSILPANNQMKNGVSTNNDTIVALNEKIKKLADGNHVYFIDVHKDMIDSDGQLKNNYTYDGLHLTRDGYTSWEKSIREYVME